MRRNSFAFFEIVELDRGDIVLRRKDEDANPLVRIQFSDEAKLYLGASVPEVATFTFRNAHTTDGNTVVVDGTTAFAGHADYTTPALARDAFLLHYNAIATAS